MGFNKVILTGKIVNVPRTYYPKRGNCILRLKLAADDSTKECHQLVFFNELAERAEEQLRQGMLLFIEGSLHYYKHEFPEDLIYGAEIHASAFEVIGNAKERVKDDVIETTKQFIVDINELLKEDSKESTSAIVVDDDLPF